MATHLELVRDRRALGGETLAERPLDDLDALTRGLGDACCKRLAALAAVAVDRDRLEP